MCPSWPLLVPLSGQVLCLGISLFGLSPWPSQACEYMENILCLEMIWVKF